MDRVDENGLAASTRDIDRGLEVLRASWGEFPWLRHGFSTRGGGVSEAYGGSDLNLGWTREDAHAAVTENRGRFLKAVEGASVQNRAMRLVTVRQMHSAVVSVVRAGDAAFAMVDGRPVLEADGLITDIPGVLVGVGTADCVPVLVADVRSRVVGAFHAGWRGTVERIVEKGIGMMSEVYGSHAEDLIAAVGPSVGSCCYVVGKEVRSQFEEQFGYAKELFHESEPPGRSETSGEVEVARQMHLNLWEANRRQLVDAGVTAERISVLRQCTACCSDGDGTRRYFSYRAEKGVTGRMLSVIGIAEAASER